MWLKLLLLIIYFVVCSSAVDPIFLLRLTGSVEYDVQLGGPRTTNFSDCAAWCRNTPRCRGMTVKEIQNTETVACRLIQFDEYKFIRADPEKADERIYLRQFTFWDETEFYFATQQSITVVNANRYIQRLKTLKLTRCLEDIPVYRKTGLLNYRMDNKTQTPCDSNRNHCSHGCPRNRHIQHHQAGYIALTNSVEWPATCYNGKWMYFDVGFQLVYPVISWNCAEEIATTTTVSLKTVLNVNAQGAKATTTSDPWRTAVKTASNSLATGLAKTPAGVTSGSGTAPTTANTSGTTMKPALTKVATTTMTSGPLNTSLLAATEKAAASRKTSASLTTMNATSTIDAGFEKSSPATATVSEATILASVLAKTSTSVSTSATLMAKLTAASMTLGSPPPTAALTSATTLLKGSTKTAPTAKIVSTTLTEDPSKTPTSETARTNAITLEKGSAKTESPASALTSATTLLKGSTKKSAESTAKSASTTPVTVSVKTPANFTKATVTTLITDPAKAQTQALAVEPPKKKQTTKKPTTKKPITKKLTTKRLTTKKPTTKKQTTKKPTTKKPTTKKPTTKKPTTKKPTTKKPTTVKKTTKRTTKKKITTPKTGQHGQLQRMGHGVRADGIHQYYQSKPAMPAGMAFQPFSFCHAVQNKPGCNMVQFGTSATPDGHHSFLNSDISRSWWKESNPRMIGWCARDRGVCGANVKLIMSRQQPLYRSLLYTEQTPHSGSQWESKFVCYMWAMENGVCPV